MSALEVALTAVQAAHNIECTGLGEVTCRGCRERGWMSWPDYRVHVASIQVDAVREWLNSDEVVALVEMTLARRHKCLEHNGPNSGPCRTDRERTALVLAALTRLADGGVG